MIEYGGRGLITSSGGGVVFNVGVYCKYLTQHKLGTRPNAGQHFLVVRKLTLEVCLGDWAGFTQQLKNSKHFILHIFLLSKHNIIILAKGVSAVSAGCLGPTCYVYHLARVMEIRRTNLIKITKRKFDRLVVVCATQRNAI